VKISLIQAEVTDTPFPPLGLLSLATILKEMGHEVKVYSPVDGDDSFIPEIREQDPALVGFSVTTAQYRRVANIIDELRQTGVKSTLCAGGPHVTALPAESIENLGIDFVVIGEGEMTIKEVVGRLSSGKELDGVAGTAHRTDGDVKINDERELISDLDSLPFADRDFVDFEKCLRPPGIIRGYPTRRSAAVMSGRGCAYDCIFCNSELMFKRKIRKRSVENVIEEIKFLGDKYKLDAIFFPDEAFTVKKDWVFNFCERFKREGLKLKWACQMRVHPIDEDVLLALKDAGCVQVEFGVESGSLKVIEILRKRITPEQVEHAFSLAKKVGLRRLATFMLGNPEEEPEDLRMTESLAKKIKPDYVSFFYTVPYPGTRLYQMAIDNGWIEHDPDFKQEWFIRQTQFPIMEINIKKEELCEFRSKLQNSFFLSNYMGYLKNLFFIMEVILSLLRHPSTFFRSIALLVKTHRLDHVIETIFKNYYLVKG